MSAIQRPRAARTAVTVPCRIRTDAGWADATIHNVSDRGLMVSMEAPPMRSSYVDIRRGTLVIVGRVVWSRGKRFGVRTQDRVRACDLLNEPVLHHRPSVGRSPDERRGPSRAEIDGRVARRLEGSRRIASAFQTACLVVVGGCLAVFLAIKMYDALAHPLAKVAVALAGSPS